MCAAGMRLHIQKYSKLLTSPEVRARERFMSFPLFLSHASHLKNYFRGRSMAMKFPLLLCHIFSVDVLCFVSLMSFGQRI